ncbi:DUF421 domain-containing protein [Luteitalea sp.]|uniref:DUF421 domain-containing protein n=1 Tax=Luteitalea sp. TaxID=2004800 RepID=UPI0025C53E67|nr:YetF domain-containing protein [Luteitalea sp.]
MIFDGWQGVLHVVVVGVVAYPALVLLLRSSGKRTLAKMNAFDFVVTVALGLLVVLQFVVAWLSVRWRWFEQIVKSEPSLLVYRGQTRDDVLLAQRVSHDEVLAALRSAGLPNIAAAGAVVLETDGTFSVIEAEALQQATLAEPWTSTGAEQSAP